VLTACKSALAAHCGPCGGEKFLQNSCQLKADKGNLLPQVLASLPVPDQ